MIIVIIILLGIGGYAGYRYSTRYSSRVTDTLIEHNTHLQQHADDWYNIARSISQFNNNVAQQHTNNIAATMHTVIQLLNTIQRQQSTALDSQETQKINTLIQQAKSIAQHHERKE